MCDDCSVSVICMYTQSWIPASATDGKSRGWSGGGWVVTVGNPHCGSAALRDAVEPNPNIQALVGAGRGEEAESKDAILGDEQVPGREWPCACQLVIWLAETNQEQEDENGEADRTHCAFSVHLWDSNESRGKKIASRYIVRYMFQVKTRSECTIEERTKWMKNRSV